MFIPPRPQREACTRTPRLLSAVTIGAVTLGATLGLVPGASADPAGERTLFVDIVGDSYMAGDGTESYLDPADPRHRSLVSPALQALSRVAGENPGLRVDANVVASSGAVTANYFSEQKVADVVVNTAQHDQVRPNAQVVVVGFGGSDAELAEVLAIAKPSNSSTPGDLAAKVKGFGGLLDTSAPDQTYLDQAAAAPLGTAPTLVSRMLQVLGGIANRAPHAHIVVTNYPVSVDPSNPHSVALIKEHDLVTVQKFVLDLNATIEKAVTICACADLVDLTEALDGHEAYTEESAYAEPAADAPHPTALGPNDRGAALMADPLSKDLATALGVRPPRPSRGKVTVPTNIAARNGESDVDGDLVPDRDDESPGDRSNHHRKKRGHPLVVLGLGDRDGRESRPDGRLPVRILPPIAPHRESGPGARPENRKTAEPDSGERKPAHKHPKALPPPPKARDAGPQWATDWRVGPAVEPAAEPSREDRSTGSPVEPDEGRPTEERAVGYEREAPFVEADDQSTEEQFGYTVRTAPAGHEREVAGPASDVREKTPATELGDEEESAAGFRSEAADNDAQPAEESAPTGDVRTPDGLLAEPAESAWRPAPEPPPEPAPEPEPASGWRAPAEDVSPVMPVTEVPKVGAPWRAEPQEESGVAVIPKEQAADGEQVCILIYPAPEGCGS